MVKEKYLILVVNLLCILFNAQSQGFDFESDKKHEAKYNNLVSEALNKDDVKRMKNILDKDNELVNSSSEVTHSSKYSVLSGGKKPLLFDAVERYLNGTVSYDMIELLLDYNPIMNCTFDGLTPFYLILKNIAKCKNGEFDKSLKLFQLFSTKSNFDINQRVNDAPPPLSFLMGEYIAACMDFQCNGKIPMNIFRTFFNAGASINTKDYNMNSLLILSILSSDDSLFELCVNNKVELTFLNKENHDVLYFAVAKNNLNAIKEIWRLGYPLNENRISIIGLESIFGFAKNEIQDYIFELLKSGNKTLEDMRVLAKLFPKRMGYFINNDYPRNRFQISLNEIPPFIKIFDDLISYHDYSNNSNLFSLKQEYVCSAGNIDDFVRKNSEVNFCKLNHFTQNFFQNENTTNSLINDISQLESVSDNLKKKLIHEIKSKSEDYFNYWISKGDINDLLRLQRDFISRKEIIEKRAYEKFVVEASVELIGFSDTEYYVYLKEGLDNLKRIHQDLDLFVKNFLDETYKSTAISKKAKCEKSITAATRIYNDALLYYKQLKNRYDNAIKKIELQGLTPNYSVLKTEEFRTLVGDQYYNYYLKVKGVQSPIFSIDVTIRKNKNNYCIDNSVLIFENLEFCADEIDRTIRKWALYKCGLYNTDFYFMKENIDKLEKEIVGNWFGKLWN